MSQILRELLHSEEGDDLVVRALHVELQLGVLIGHPQRFDRQGPRVDHLPLSIDLLAQALAPQLPVPVGHVAQAGGVRHHDADASSEPRVLQELDAGESAGGVFPPVCLRDPVSHVTRTGKQPGHVHPGQRRRQQAHRGEDREPPSHSAGKIEHTYPQRVSYLAQHALGRIGGEDQVVFQPRRAHSSLEALLHHQVSGHRLGSRARLGDDVDQGAIAGAAGGVARRSRRDRRCRARRAGVCPHAPRVSTRCSGRAAGPWPEAVVPRADPPIPTTSRHSYLPAFSRREIQERLRILLGETHPTQHPGALRIEHRVASSVQAGPRPLEHLGGESRRVTPNGQASLHIKREPMHHVHPPFTSRTLPRRVRGARVPAAFSLVGDPPIAAALGACSRRRHHGGVLPDMIRLYAPLLRFYMLTLGGGTPITKVAWHDRGDHTPHNQASGREKRRCSRRASSHRGPDLHSGWVRCRAREGHRNRCRGGADLQLQSQDVAHPAPRP